MKTTLRDVASRAGVSLTTASFVLNERAKSGIPTTTCARVRQAAEELGYRPNGLARSLLSGQTHTLGFLIHCLTNPFAAELVDALHDAAFARGYDLSVALDGYSFEQEVEHLERFVERRVDGILVWAGQPRSRYLNGRLLGPHSTPYVALGHHTNDDETPYVEVDRLAAMEMAVEHLVNMGRTQIGYVGFDVSEPPAPRCKYAGFLDALRRRGLEPCICIPGDPVRGRARKPGEMRRAGYDAGVRLAASGRIPHGILCSSDEIALGAIAALYDRGIRVPEDLAVIGFDGMAEGAFSRPRLTTLAQPLAEMVERSLEAVLQLMKDPTGPPPRVTVVPRLVVRESCGALLAGNQASTRPGCQAETERGSTAPTGVP